MSLLFPLLPQNINSNNKNRISFFDSGLFILVIKSKKNKKLMHLEVLDVCDFPYIYSLSVRQFLKISFVFEATVTRTTVFDLSSSFLKWK